MNSRGEMEPFLKKKFNQAENEKKNNEQMDEIEN